VQQLYLRAQRTGVADGVADNWDFLGRYTNDSGVDFHHATGYLQGASKAAHPRSFAERERWLEDRCHRLKHKAGAAREILGELEGLTAQKLSEAARKEPCFAAPFFQGEGNAARPRTGMSRHAKQSPQGVGTQTVTLARAERITSWRMQYGRECPLYVVNTLPNRVGRHGLPSP
jgi:hypothetical protein